MRSKAWTRARSRCSSSCCGAFRAGATPSSKRCSGGARVSASAPSTSRRKRNVEVDQRPVSLGGRSVRPGVRSPAGEGGAEGQGTGSERPARQVEDAFDRGPTGTAVATVVLGVEVGKLDPEAEVHQVPIER